jgi:DNA-binding MarR family transcriptional regulator
MIDTVWTAETAAAELLAVLPLLTRIVASEVRREIGEETTMPQFRVLAQVAEGPLTVSALARKRRVSLQSMGELVQGLVERGWIARSPDPKDRRQYQLTLTPEGRSQYERANAQAIGQITPLLANLSEAELAALQCALPALQRALEADIAEHEPRILDGNTVKG